MPRRQNPFRYDILLEDHAPLSARALNERGVFDGELLDTFVFEIGGRQVHIKYFDSQSALIIRVKIGRKFLDQAFKVKRIFNNFGYKYYFLCNRTGKPVTTLYFDDDQFWSRHALQRPYTSRAGPVERAGLEAWKLGRRLIGADGRGPARGENRDRIARRLIALGQFGAILDDPVILAINKQMSEGGASQKHRPRKIPDAIATRTAAKRLRKKGYVSPSIIISGMLEEIRWTRKRFPAPPAGDVLPASIDFNDRYPCLSLRELSSMMPPSEGEIWAEALRWDLPTVGPLEAWICVDRHPGRRFAMIRFWSRDAERVQQIAEIVLGAQQNPKKYFVCPVTGAKTEALCFRDGRFASARAQRLIHRSQRVDPRLRALFTANRMR